jgi:hypothetical protein
MVTRKHLNVMQGDQKVSVHQIIIFIIYSGSAAQRGLWPPRFTWFLDHTQRRVTVGRTPLDE